MAELPGLTVEHMQTRQGHWARSSRQRQAHTDCVHAEVVEDAVSTAGSALRALTRVEGIQGRQSFWKVRAMASARMSFAEVNFDLAVTQLNFKPL